LSAKKRKQLKQQPSPPSELGIKEALQFAIFAHRTSKLDDAEQLYKRILETVPDQPDALHFLGVLTHQRGHSAEAIELINRSIALDPSQPDRYNNLGNVLLETGRVDEAVSAYEKNIELAPDHADAYNNIGTVYKAQQRFAEAALAYGKAIAINPRHSDAYNNLGNLMAGRASEAANNTASDYAHPQPTRGAQTIGVAYTCSAYEAAADVPQVARGGAGQSGRHINSPPARGNRYRRA
jgi:Flp pilus assembly protein TadD